MKKIVLVIALAAILATGTAFADHPGGLGIGIVGFYPGGVGLSLKLPGLPVYWGISAALGSDYFVVAVSGDFYLIDAKLIPTLNWFLGIGGFFDFYNYSASNSAWSDYSHTWMAFGGRIPIGLSWQPIPLLELFADWAPHLGLYIDGGTKYKIAGQPYETDGKMGFHGGWTNFELGIRLWL